MHIGLQIIDRSIDMRNEPMPGAEDDGPWTVEKTVEMRSWEANCFRCPERIVVGIQ